MKAIVAGLADQHATDDVLGHHVAGDAHFFGHFLMGQTIKTIENKGFTAAPGQAFDGRVEGLCVLAECQHFLRLQVPGGQGLLFFQQRVQAQVRADCGAAVLVNQQIARGTEQQRADPRWRYRNAGSPGSACRPLAPDQPQHCGLSGYERRNSAIPCSSR